VLPSGRGEEGFSLVEVLITIVIVGVTFAALLGGLITTITVSSVHRKQATADSVVRSAAEWIKDGVQTPYAPCGGVGPYNNSLSNLPRPSGYSAVVQTVEYWDGASAVAGTPYALNSGIGGHLGTGCPGTGDKGLQRITIVVTSSNPPISETVQIIKRSV